MESLDYKKFSFYKDNRVVNKGSVRKIVESIEELGYVKGKPIIVSSEFEIIDGQHRFLACQELELPIIYEFQEVEDYHKMMISLNKTQSNWDLKDYVHLHAKQLIECYVRLSQFEDKYNFGMSNSITICFGHRSGNQIREGFEFPLNKKRDQIAAFLYECKPFLSYWKNTKFITAISEVFRVCLKEDIEKIESKAIAFKQQANTSDYLQLFENAINKGRSKRISLIH